MFDSRVRLAGNEVAPLHPWVGHGAKSAIWAHSACATRESIAPPLWIRYSMRTRSPTSGLLGTDCWMLAAVAMWSVVMGNRDPEFLRPRLDLETGGFSVRTNVSANFFRADDLIVVHSHPNCAVQENFFCTHNASLSLFLSLSHSSLSFFSLSFSLFLLSLILLSLFLSLSLSLTYIESLSLSHTHTHTLRNCKLHTHACTDSPDTRTHTHTFAPVN